MVLNQRLVEVSQAEQLTAGRELVLVGLRSVLLSVPPSMLRVKIRERALRILGI